jgi:DNA replication and repair protein RecF
MPFTGVSLSSFRNLADDEIPVDADRIFLVGENGQGKTNFLEALYYLCYGSSFRGPVDAEVSRRGGDGFSVRGSSSERSASPGLPPNEIRVSWDGRAKAIALNGKPLRDRKELVEQNPAVVFCHEDYAFAAGEPERRRFFFDQTASLVALGYIDSLRDYRRVLKQRNSILKEGQGREDILDLIDQQFAAHGISLMEARSKLQAEFDGRFALRYEAVSLLGREVRLRYRPSWPAEGGLEAVLEKLRAKRPEEYALGTSLSGPHRDRWVFISEGSDFAATASTGQLRLLSLTLRMVQAEHYTALTGRLPVLLLDDVLLELDRGKRKRFLELLPDAAQAFFTFLPGEPWEDYRTGSTLVYEVSDGRLAH